MSANEETLMLAQLLDAPATEVRRTALPSEAFTGPRRHIYRAMMAVSCETSRVTAEAIVAEMRERGTLDAGGGAEAVERLAEQAGMALLDGVRAEVASLATARILADATKAAHGLAVARKTREASEVMQDALRAVQGISGAGEAVVLKTMSDHMRDYAKMALDYGTGKLKIVKAEIGAFSDSLGELEPGSCNLIYGFSQTKKSHLMQFFERRYAEQGCVTLRLSLEDPDKLNAGRLMSEAAGIDATRLTKLNRDDWAAISRATSRSEESWKRRIIVNHRSTVESCCATMRRAASEAGAKVVFVDYAQILHTLSGSEESQEQRIGRSAAMLKETANECGQMLWLGSQVVVRDPKKVNKPTPFDLKGARSLYEMSEGAIALWWDGDGLMAEVQKNKAGTGTVQGRLVSGPGGVVVDVVPHEPREEEPAQRSYRATGGHWTD